MLLPFLVLWLVVGIIIGFLFSKILNLRGDQPGLGIGVAGLGAIAGGISCNLYSGHGFIGWYTWSIAFAAMGGFVAAVIWHLIRSRFVSHERSTVRRSY